MGRFVSVSLGLLVVAISIMGTRYTCLQGWYFRNGHCFKIFEEAKNWDDAEMFCKKLDIACHLASIHIDVASHDFAVYVSSHIKKARNVWIGLHYPLNKNKWQWSNWRLTDHFAWADGKPDLSKTRNTFCVALEKETKYFQWSDLKCEELNPFLCECRSIPFPQ